MSSFRSEPRPESGFDKGYAIQDGNYVWEIDNQIISVSGADWQAIVAAYSREGRNLTKNEVALEFDIPRTVLERMFKAAGVYKTSPPFTAEVMDLATSEEDLDDLVAASLEMKTHRFFAKLQRREIAALRAEVDELRAKEKDERRAASYVADALGSLTTELPAPPKKRVRIRAGRSPSSRSRDQGYSWACHAPVADLHVGKLVYGKQDMGKDYDLDIAASRLVGHGAWLAAKISAHSGICTCYLTDLGDLVHSLRGQTDSGTHLGQDSRDKKVFRDAVAARVAQIEAVRPAARNIVVMGVEGNHASFADWVVTEALSVRYEATPDVEVRTTFRPQAHFLVGKSLHLLDHGKGVGKLTAWKAQAQLDVVAREVAGADFREAENVYLYVGHLHELQVGSLGKHAQLIRLPSFGESDSYESSLRYASLPVAHAFALDEQGRIEEEWRHYFNG